MEYQSSPLSLSQKTLLSEFLNDCNIQTWRNIIIYFAPILRIDMTYSRSELYNYICAKGSIIYNYLVISLAFSTPFVSDSEIDNGDGIPNIDQALTLVDKTHAQLFYQSVWITIHNGDLFFSRHDSGYYKSMEKCLISGYRHFHELQTDKTKPDFTFLSVTSACVCSILKIQEQKLNINCYCELAQPHKTSFFAYEEPFNLSIQEKGDHLEMPLCSNYNCSRSERITIYSVSIERSGQMVDYNKCEYKVLQHNITFTSEITDIFLAFVAYSRGIWNTSNLS